MSAPANRPPPLPAYCDFAVGLVRLDPFDFSDASYQEITPGTTIRGWLDESGLWETLHHTPIVVFHNAEALTEDQYDTVLSAGDIVLAAGQPGEVVLATGWLIAFWIGFSFSVAAAAYSLYLALTMDLDGPTDAGEQSPTYSITYRGNRRRPGQPIPVVYGEMRVWPDYTGSFSEFDDANNQWLVQLFDISQGEVIVDENYMYYEDTKLVNFSERKLEVLLPGQSSKLFPNAVFVSDEVSGIEIVYPPDDGFPNGVAANPAGSEINRIAVDVQAPRGIYKVDDGGPDAGDIDFHKVPITVEYREIDDFGNPTGSWTIAVLDDGTQLDGYELTSVNSNRQDAVRRTLAFDVDQAGRYEVRIYRGTADSESQYTIDDLVWGGLRAFQPSSFTTTTTRVAIRVRQSERIGNASLSQFNLIVRRKLSIHNGSSWQAPVFTQHPVWAFADALRADWGGRIPDERIDIDELVTLAAAYPNEQFNGVFDTKQTLWSALQDITRPMLARPIQRLDGRFSIALDLGGMPPVAMFTMRNIIRDSLEIEHVSVNSETNDSVKITYFDKNQDYREASILCVPSGSAGTNPAERTIRGVTDADRAYRVGIRMANENKYRRRLVSFSTGLEGYLPAFGEVVRVSHFLIGSETGLRSVSGEVKTYISNTFAPYDDITSFNGLPNLYVVIRNRDGNSQGPLACTVSGGVIVAPGFNESAADTSYMLYALGEGTQHVYDVKVTSISPGNEHTVKIEGFVDDQNAYIQGGTPVPSPLPPLTNILPEVYNLKFSLRGRTSQGDQSAQTLVVSWMGRRADFYEVEYSLNSGASWVLYTRTIDTYVEARPPITTDLRVRVTGVNILRGTPVEISINTRDYFLELPRISGLRLVDDFVADRASIAWIDPPFFTSALVRVYWGSPPVLRREIEVWREVSRFDYTIDMAIEDGDKQHDGLPIADDGARNIEFQVYVVDGLGNMSAAPTTLAVENDQILSVPNVRWFESGGDLNIKYQYPVAKSIADFAGVEIHMSPTSGFVPDESTLVYAGDSNDITLIGVLDPNSVYYLRVGGYDIWGRDGINYSDQARIDTSDDVYTGIIDWGQIVGPGKPDDNANLSGKGLLNPDPDFSLTWQKGFGIYWVNELIGKVSLIELSTNDYAMRVEANSGTGAYFSTAQYFEILAGEPVTFKARFLYSSDLSHIGSAEVGARYYDKDKNLIGTEILVDLSLPLHPPNVFVPYVITFTPTDPNTKFITLFAGLPPHVTAGSIQLDHIKAVHGEISLTDGINLLPPSYAIYDAESTVLWESDENGKAFIDPGAGVYGPGFLKLIPDYDGSLGYTNDSFTMGRANKPPITISSGSIMPIRRFVLSFWMRAGYSGGSAPNGAVTVKLFFPGQTPNSLLPIRGLRVTNTGACSGMAANTWRQFAAEFDLTDYPGLLTGTIEFQTGNYSGLYVYLDGLMFQRRTGEHSLNDFPALRSLNTIGPDSLGTGNLLPDSVIARWLSQRTTDFVPPSAGVWHRVLSAAGIEWKAGNQMYVEGSLECSSSTSHQIALRLVTTSFSTSRATIFNVEMSSTMSGVARFSFKIGLTFASPGPEIWHLDAQFASTSITVRPDSQTYLLIQEEKR